MARYRLKLSKLDFISPVDAPAQETARVLLMKRGGEFSASARVAKVDDGLGLVFCWAFTSTNPDGSTYHDLQGDAIDADFIKAAAEFMQGSAATDEMHDGKQTGRVVFAMPMTPEIAKAYGVETRTTGLMVALKPPPEVLAKFKSGEYTGVSIAGTGVREVVKNGEFDESKHPRDPHGRFGSGGGGGSAEEVSAHAKDATARARESSSGDNIRHAQLDHHEAYVAHSQAAAHPGQSGSSKKSHEAFAAHHAYESARLGAEYTSGAANGITRSLSSFNGRHAVGAEQHKVAGDLHYRAARLARSQGLNNHADSHEEAAFEHHAQADAHDTGVSRTPNRVSLPTASKAPKSPRSRSKKRYSKLAVLTSSTDGHQHGIDLDDPEYSDKLTTSPARSEGQESAHNHIWVYDRETGEITIAEDSGHTHTVDAVVPADVIAEAVSRGDGDNDEDEGGVTLQPIAARAPQRNSTHPGAAPTVKSNTQENPPMDPKFAKMLSLALLLPETQRAHVAKLAPDDQAAFLAKSAQDRDAIAKAAADADPVVHTSAVDGTVYRKSDDHRLVAMAKRADEQAAELAVEKAARERVELEKRAGAELSHFGKNIGVRAALLKAVDGIADEATRKDAHEALKGANAALVSIGKAIGASGGEPQETDALAAYNTALAKHAASIDPKMHPVDATASFLSTSEGKAAKAAYDATRAYGRA